MNAVTNSSNFCWRCLSSKGLDSGWVKRSWYILFQSMWGSGGKVGVSPLPSSFPFSSVVAGSVVDGVAGVGL